MIYDPNIPIYLQVIKDIKAKISNGDMKPGDKMPSARELAIQYQINPNTSSRVYKELEQGNVCYTKRGLGTFVTEDNTRLAQIKEEMAAELIGTFVKGMKKIGYTKSEIIHILERRYDDMEE